MCWTLRAVAKSTLPSCTARPSGGIAGSTGGCRVARSTRSLGVVWVNLTRETETEAAAATARHGMRKIADGEWGHREWGGAWTVVDTPDYSIPI